jgi:hypothetical protein
MSVAADKRAVVAAFTVAAEFMVRVVVAANKSTLPAAAWTEAAAAKSKPLPASTLTLPEVLASAAARLI